MHPIENILKTTMEELKRMTDVNTVVGEPFIAPDGQTIIPISKVSFGFVSGGGEYGKNASEELPFAGGSASGVSISPVAFMVGKNEDMRLIPVNDRNALDKVMENAPKLIDEIKNAVYASRGANGSGDAIEEN